MTDERKQSSDPSTAREPELTERNTRTIRGEENLAGDKLVTSGSRLTSYGEAGNTTDATEEGGDGTGI